MGKEQNKNIGKNNPAAIYKNEDGTINLSVFIENETVWLTQKLLAELFDVEELKKYLLPEELVQLGMGGN